MLLRMQDDSGRGPWRPGLTNQWLDEFGPDLPPAIHEEIQQARYSEVRLKTLMAFQMLKRSEDANKR
ncbi:MAG: hypothetical protein AAF217_13770 [Pseudomonadota bacterium]